MSKKVLIVYATGGMGHVSAAKAIENVFKTKYKDVEVKNVDVIDYASSIYKKIFVDGYNYVSSKHPDVWGMLYHKYNKPSKQKIPSLISRLAIEGKFIPFVKKFNPDFMISTHPLPMILVSHSKRKEVINIQSSLVVTDFGCHSFWVDKEVNYYFTATPDVGKCLQNYGVQPGQSIATGIPIMEKFSTKFNKQALLKKLKLKSGRSTVLIVGGQFSFSALQKIINGVNKKHGEKVQFIIVAGRDHVLKAALEKSDLNQSSNINVYGFVDNMQELMTVSDLIFSKAGGLTVSECMAKGLPMVINKVIPGQEEDNVEYLTSKGAAIKANNFNGIVSSVNDLIANPAKLKKMKQVALTIGRPNSAKDLAEFVYKKISK
ncbi:MAG: hypothetical protein CMI53_02980 [Parcubacteria group bacterium]|nr:hypothetical protein [Parcubacteria group bacterium]|tara:strand:- start:6472 stop:7596 length:1125 start_codon:yes stop_codon:yes gene_type:complete